MKKVRNSLLVMILLCGGACDDMLEVSPLSSITVASMWESPEDAWGALYGAYNQFRGAYGGNYHDWGDYRTGYYGDGVQPGRFYKANLFDNNLIPDDDGTDWGSLYTLINDCNLILKYTPDIEFVQSKDKDFIMGNAYFLRAFAYYYIARIWGDAPVLTQPHESATQENLYPVRNPVAEVFALVKQDVEKAVALIPDGMIPGKGVASRETANMLKADVYLWLSKVRGEDLLDEANAAVDYVLNSGNYSLADNYADVFEDDANNENMFSVIYDQNESTRNEGFIQPAANVPAAIQNNPVAIQSGTNWYNITRDYRDFLREDPADVRAETTAAEFTYNDGGVEKYFLWIDKYKGSLVSGTRIFDTDYRVYRYAEALLFKAEILNEKGDQESAVSFVNQVVERAYGTDNYYSGTYSKEEVDEIILDERIKEFSTEGKAWFDMIRFGKAFERIPTLAGKESVENVLLWPVSYNTINRNDKIAQTPGYE
ncbi:MAG TPA: RagB/SusD family nutrient uptake outer membrane protein [Chryseosolibacter sp.]|nr:RagB/SusD family nutrient uptake outer membrane protein [Chryseosolibacter sp.]